MDVMASQITSLTIFYSTVYSGARIEKMETFSASLAFVRGIHWWPVNSPHKWPLTRKMFPFDDFIMVLCNVWSSLHWWIISTNRTVSISSYRWFSARLKFFQCVSNLDYKNPLHLDVVDRYLRRMGDKTIPDSGYLRRMGDKTIPDEAPPSLESFFPPWVAGIDLPQSRCCGLFGSFTNKHK